MVRKVLLGLAGSSRAEQLMTQLPVSSDIVSRFVAGTGAREAVGVCSLLDGVGLTVTVDRLGEDTVVEAHAANCVGDYLELLDLIDKQGLQGAVEVSIKLSALGQALPEGGHELSIANAEQICARADELGTRVTVDMEDHTTTDHTLEAVARLREKYPDTGAVVQAYLHRTEADCRTLAQAGVRVRLCKGAYSEPASVAFADPHEVDKSYVRCLAILMQGAGYPMVATHDPTLIAIAKSFAARFNRESDSYEFQMLYGVRPLEQRALVRDGHQVRIYLPYGRDWYGYLIRRLAERPQNLAFFVRSLISKR